MEKDEVGFASKVPEVTLGFWIIKIAATTLGETGGDTVTMTLNSGSPACSSPSSSSWLPPRLPRVDFNRCSGALVCE